MRGETAAVAARYSDGCAGHLPRVYRGWAGAGVGRGGVGPLAGSAGCAARFPIVTAGGDRGGHARRGVRELDGKTGRVAAARCGRFRRGPARAMGAGANSDFFLRAEGFRCGCGCERGGSAGRMPATRGAAAVGGYDAPWVSGTICTGEEIAEISGPPLAAASRRTRIRDTGPFEHGRRFP